MKLLTPILLACLLGRLEAAESDKRALEGNEAIKAGNWDLAIAKYSEVIREDPKNAIVLADRGLAYQQKKDYGRALADFDEAIRLKPILWMYYDRGVTRSENGNQDGAITDFDKALKAQPASKKLRADILAGRARAFFLQEKSEPALRDANAAIRSDATNSDAFFLRGILRKISHDYTASLADYEKALALDPKNPQYLQTEAYLLSVCPNPQFRDGKKAIARATKACELTSWKDADNLRGLAAAYAENAQFDDAIKWQTQAGELGPSATDSKRLALYEGKQPFRDLNRKEEPIPDLTQIGEHVSVKLGRQVTANLELSDDKMIHPGIGTSSESEPHQLWLDYRQTNKGRTLYISHSCPRPLHYRCLARLKGYDTYFETDVLPVPVKTKNPEIWTEPIDELVLFDFKFVEASYANAQASPSLQPWISTFAQDRCSLK